MSRCPFWSTSIENISCYTECPMQAESKKGDICPFKEVLIHGKKEYVDIVGEEYLYSQEKYSRYDISEKIINY